MTTTTTTTTTSLPLPLSLQTPNPKPNHLPLLPRLHPQTLTLVLPPLRRRLVPPPPLASTSSASTAASSFFSAASGVAREGAGDHFRAPVIAFLAAAAKWLGMYREILMVGILLSWFPNIPWNRQPFAAIRDLCDPFLALCREIIPPLWRRLDLSPLLAFMVLEVIISLLRANAGVV